MNQTLLIIEAITRSVIGIGSVSMLGMVVHRVMNGPPIQDAQTVIPLLINAASGFGGFALGYYFSSSPRDRPAPPSQPPEKEPKP